MTGDELDRAIEFLLKNQADFDARMTRLEATQAEASQQQAETSQQIHELTAGHRQTKEFIDQLSQIVAQNTQQISHINDVLLTVVEGEKRNKDDIDALIKLVGGLIEGRNGKSQG